MDWLQIIYGALATLAVLHGLLLCAQTWEHRRFCRSRLRNVRSVPPEGRVLLLAPCKGLDLGQDENLRALFVQDHPDFELCFIVESAEDAARDAIERVRAEFPRVNSRVVVAGIATDCGQKIHNLLAATRRLGAEIKMLAFVDSDARPAPNWLRHLTQHLDSPEVAAATSYRWFIPEHSGLANSILYSINSAVAPLVGPGPHTMVWGGAWAIRREQFEHFQIRERWQETISDDLVVTSILQACRAKIEFEPGCMTASPLQVSFAGMFSFARRQYTIGRIYTRGWWQLGFAFLTIVQGTFWLGVLSPLYAMACGAPVAWLQPLVSLAIYVLSCGRAALRQDASRITLPAEQSRLRGVRWFDILLAPLAGVVNWAAMASSAVGQTITWRNVRYTLTRDGKVLQVEHLDQFEPAVLPLPSVAGQQSRRWRRAS